ncbi:MAG: NifB/NifX family molybdenum-iron cluster-binding protein [Methanomicrobiaceae archaeon]|nr:NifB/NifX family molybdenum-iron cluster-binding protein [Methanomicrobiaceae archaeon]
MKICITSKEESPESRVEKSFGRTPFIAVYDTESKEFNFIENTNRNLAGGVGPKTAQMVINCGAKILITGMIGENAKNVIDAAEIRIITVSDEKTIKEAVSDFEKENPAN